VVLEPLGGKRVIPPRRGNKKGNKIIANPDIFLDEYLSFYHPREKFARRPGIRRWPES
jgi:hypothetical protein